MIVFEQIPFIHPKNSREIVLLIIQFQVSQKDHRWFSWIQWWPFSRFFIFLLFCLLFAEGLFHPFLSWIFQNQLRNFILANQFPIRFDYLFATFHQFEIFNQKLHLFSLFKLCLTINPYQIFKTLANLWNLHLIHLFICKQLPYFLCHPLLIIQILLFPLLL